MKIEKKILWAISLSALSLCTYNQPVLASDTDVEILNYVEDQRREARDKEKNKAINEFKAELDAQYEKEGIVIQNPQEAPIIFEGNDIMYDSVTGEVYGKGNVKITQNYSRMTTEDANGNLNTGDVDIPVHAHVRPFRAYWLNILCGILVPVGLFFYFRIWAFRIRLSKDVDRIVKNNNDVIHIIQSIKQNQ